MSNSKQTEPTGSGQRADKVLPKRFVVEPYTGPNEPLQEFVVSTWSDAYSGRMSFPVWSKEYFDWQFAPRDDEPNRRLVVYDGDQMVAALLGTPTAFRTPSTSFRGAHWSWLSVAESHRGFRLATLLDEARVALERSVNSELVVSYRFTGSKHSLAEQPSSRFPLKKFHSRVGFWARPLDGKKLHGWNLDRTEGFLSRVVTPLLPSVHCLKYEEIRRFDLADLADCLDTVQQEFDHHTLTIDWNDQSLKHQLAGSPATQTVVCEHAGFVRGLINFHILPFDGATREPVGIIDMICVKLLPARMQVALLRSALRLMQEQGAVLALKVRCRDISVPLMFRTGFMPRLPDSSLVLQWTQHVQEIPQHRPMHLLWR